MPGAIGWAAALLPSRGSVIAGPSVQLWNSGPAILRAAIRRSRKSRKPFATRHPNLRPGKLDRPVKYTIFRCSNFLTLRGAK